MVNLCRVCIKEAAKCTPLNTNIEDSSNQSFLDFLNKCTTINACDNDKLPQSLCPICSDSIRRFYAFVKLAEKSDIILRDALKNSIAKGRYSDNREISSEGITITNGKIQEEYEDFNKEYSFHCQTRTSLIESQLYIVKEEPCISESTSIPAKINESNAFRSNLDYSYRSAEKPNGVLSCPASHLASIHEDHSEAEDDVSASLLKRRSPINVDESSQSNFFPKVHGNSSNVKRKVGKPEPKSFNFSCEEITIRNEEIEAGSEDFNKEDLFHCQASTNPTGSSLYILDIVKEEPRIIESTSIDPKIKDNDEFQSNFHHLEGTSEKPDGILIYKDGDLTSLDEDHSDTEDNVPISILKRELVKNMDTYPQKIKIESSYESEECDMIFNDEKFRTDYQNNIVGDKHECNICGKTFANSKYLEYHLEIHDVEKRYKCAICEKSFKHYSSQQLHMRIHSDRESFTCKICSKKFARTDHLKRHMKSHNGAIIKKCDQSDSESLITHMEWHTNPKPFKCENCGKSFVWKQNYTRHMEICKPVGNLNEEEAHRKERTQNTSTEGDIACSDNEKFRTHCRSDVYEDKYKCNICGRKFARLQLLQYHSISHDERKKYKCSICGKRFKRAGCRERHMRIHSDGKPFECEICCKKFGRKNHLKIHMESHSEITNKCNQCDKEFKYTKGLRRHMKWHTEPKPFKCEVCGRLFASKFNYITHMKWHTNPKSFKCENCDKLFGKKYNYTRHMEICKPVDTPSSRLT